jgi:hypothetical protein
MYRSAANCPHVLAANCPPVDSLLTCAASCLRRTTTYRKAPDLLRSREGKRKNLHRSLSLLSAPVEFQTLELQLHLQIEENNDHERGTTATTTTKSQEDDPTVHESRIGFARRGRGGLLSTAHRRHQDQATARPIRDLQGHHPLRLHNLALRGRAGSLEGIDPLCDAFDTQVHSSDVVQCDAPECV